MRKATAMMLNPFRSNLLAVGISAACASRVLAGCNSDRTTQRLCSSLPTTWAGPTSAARELICWKLIGSSFTPGTDFAESQDLASEQVEKATELRNRFAQW